jgi:hypothetical protein
MADLEPKKISAEHKLTEELGVFVSFLDPHLKTRNDTKPMAKPAMWSLRKMFAVVLITGIVGWSAVLGLVYLLWTFL